MSSPHKIWIRQNVIGFLSVFLLSFGFTACLLRIISVREEFIFPCLGICFLISAFLFIWNGIRLKHKSIVLFLLLGLLGLFSIWGKGPVFAFVQAAKTLYLNFQGNDAALYPYMNSIYWLLCTFFSLIFYIVVKCMDYTSICLWISDIVFIFVLLKINDATNLYFALFFVLGQLLLMGKYSKRFISLLIISVLLMGLTFVIMPDTLRTIPSVEKIAKYIYTDVHDYLLFDTVRNAFDVASQGYQPLGERLGGALNIDDQVIMEVESEQNVLLRGCTYDTYNGLNWYDTVSTERYLFLTPSIVTKRDQILDMNRPIVKDNIDRQKELSVRILSENPSTIYVPGRLQSIQMKNDHMTLYFNESGECFITRNLQAGDAYTVSYDNYPVDSLQTQKIIEQCAEKNDDNIENIKQTYLQLPEYSLSLSEALCEEIIQGAETDFEKVYAIRGFLRKNYRYTLDVSNPPSQVDFVSWFLFGEKEGYCVYFASAMTVLCRIAGIPARYVTGYAVEPDLSGKAVVTSKNAHAWTEVYFYGFGWLAIDATPVLEQTVFSDELKDNQDDVFSVIDETDFGDLAVEGEKQTENESTIIPSPAPVSVETEIDVISDTPTPQGNKMTNLPNENDTHKMTETDHYTAWLILGFLFIVILLRFYLSSPAVRAQRKPAQATDVFMAAIIKIMKYHGLRKNVDETIDQFSLRAAEQMGYDGIREVFALYEQKLYGDQSVPKEPFENLYRQLLQDTSFTVRLKLSLERFC